MTSDSWGEKGKSGETKPKILPVTGQKPPGHTRGRCGICAKAVGKKPTRYVFEPLGIEAHFRVSSGYS